MEACYKAIELKKKRNEQIRTKENKCLNGTRGNKVVFPPLVIAQIELCRGLVSEDRRLRKFFLRH